MGRHDLPSEIKPQEIGKAQDQYLLFKNKLKSNLSVKSKGILGPKNISSPESAILVPDNMEPHDSSFNVEQISKLPPRNPNTQLSEIEESIWDELSYKEEQQSPLYLLCCQQHQ